MITVIFLLGALAGATLVFLIMAGASILEDRRQDILQEENMDEDEDEDEHALTTSIGPWPPNVTPLRDWRPGQSLTFMRGRK